jgi:hypothetical protein
MILLHIFSFLSTLSKDKPLWVDFLQIAITVALAVWGYLRAFKAWERQKKREIDLQFDQKRFESRIEACKGIWALLAYLSMWENEQTLFVKRGGKWYLRKDQGVEYLKKLPEVFFVKGFGVFMPVTVKEGLYKVRGIVYSIIDEASHKNSGENEIELKNQELPKEVIQKISEEINSTLRAMLLDSKIEFKD